MPLRQCFEFNDSSINSHKYWNVKVNGDAVKFEWGRIGTSGQSLDKNFPGSGAAMDAALKKINEKAREGYKQIPC